MIGLQSPNFFVAVKNLEWLILILPSFVTYAKKGLFEFMQNIPATS